jgi:lysophospholipase L1-like esterase
MLILLELYLNLFFAQPDSIYNLAQRNWLSRYWSSNSLGYRDIEWSPELLDGQTKIMVLGDSIVAGAGIEDSEDRFPDLLSRKLGDGYAVMNVGRPGAGTKEEIENALDYPYQPDLVILTFFVNDIEETAHDMGFPPPRTDPLYYPQLARESYLFNFLFWRLYRLGLLGSGNNFDDYWDWLSEAYNNPDIWQIYQQELLQIYHLVRKIDGQLIVIVFPLMQIPEESRPMTGQVVNLYREQGLPVLDVTELVSGLDPRQLIVSPEDAHPNEFVHQLVAEELFRLVLESQQSESGQE